MKKTITTWLAGAAVLFAMAGSLPAMAQDVQTPEPATTTATTAAPATTPAVAAPAPAAEAAAPAAEAAPAPVPHKGDTAWMFIATILVVVMAIPGLALFYGGLVRSKNMLSV